MIDPGPGRAMEFIMQRFRKLPIVVEAMVWDNADNTLTTLRRAGCSCYAEDGQEWLRISTLEGTMEARPGDYIIKGVKGEFYPCKPDIFAATYQPEASAVLVEGVDLEEVLRLDREGTPGPWHMRAAETENGYGTHAVSPDSAIEDGLSPTDLVLVGRTITIGVSGHDAALIATYRTAAPALAREVARLRALLGAEQTRAETYNEENREVVRALEDAGQLRAGKDSVAAVRALHAEVQRLQAERDRLDALAAGLFDGVPTSPENALTWLHQEVMRTLTTPNWPGVLVEILLERVRQIEKGYDAAHDDKLTAFELSTVAAAVTLGTVEHLPVSGDARELTGHIIEKWDIRRRLVIAAALVVAEIERLDRKQGGRTT